MQTENPDKNHWVKWVTITLIFFSIILSFKIYNFSIAITLPVFYLESILIMITLVTCLFLAYLNTRKSYVFLTIFMLSLFLFIRSHISVPSVYNALSGSFARNLIFNNTSTILYFFNFLLMTFIILCGLLGIYINAKNTKEEISRKEVAILPFIALMTIIPISMLLESMINCRDMGCLGLALIITILVAVSSPIIIFFIIRKRYKEEPNPTYFAIKETGISILYFLGYTSLAFGS